MFDTYTIDLTTWGAVDRATLDASVSGSSRVFFNGVDEYAKMKLLPIASDNPETAVFQISTSQCDATGKAIQDATTGEIVLTSPRRITASHVSPDATIDEQLNLEIETELRLYGLLLTSRAQRLATIAIWGA